MSECSFLEENRTLWLGNWRWWLFGRAHLSASDNSYFFLYNLPSSAYNKILVRLRRISGVGACKVKVTEKTIAPDDYSPEIGNGIDADND